MASITFHSIPVADVRKETANCVSVAFDIPEELRNEFTFEAGQYITIKANIEGEEIRRSYSLCSSPFDKDFRVAIKQVHGGLFSTYANQTLKKGDILDIMPPMGNFIIKPDNTPHKQYVGIAAGSGITPILSMIKTVLASDPTSHFSLIYGNQNFHSIIFREEIEALKNKYIGRLQVIHVLSRERMESEINYGRINADKCDRIFKSLIDLKQISQYFLCGPEEMILDITSYLTAQGIDQKNIRFELFTSTKSTQKKQQNQESNPAKQGKVSIVTIKVDDRSIDVPLAYGGETILDAALKHGADLPYACKGGVCCTCKAKVIEGSVSMEVNYALDPDEVENGFILTCQAHPTSEKVIIDFDAR